MSWTYLDPTDRLRGIRQLRRALRLRSESIVDQQPVVALLARLFSLPKVAAGAIVYSAGLGGAARRCEASGLPNLWLIRSSSAWACSNATSLRELPRARLAEHWSALPTTDAANAGRIQVEGVNRRPSPCRGSKSPWAVRQNGSGCRSSAR